MRIKAAIVVSLALLVTAPSVADDITGASHLLCATVRATECFASGLCYPGNPEEWDSPRFVKLDFEEEMHRTFNMGIGMVAIVPASAGNAIVSAAPEAMIIGKLDSRIDDEAQVRLQM